MDRLGTALALSRPHLAALAAMLVAAALALTLAPRKVDVSGGAFDLGALVPGELGGWREVRSPFVQVDLTPRRDGEDAERTTDSPYDQTVMRTYARADGATIMLALAYGSRQRQEVKIHRPELCYVAQGFAVSRKNFVPLVFKDGNAVTATRLVAHNDRRVEPVTYWIRIGDEIAMSAVQSRLAILREGLRGRIPDGILVRVSSVHPPGTGDLDGAYRLHEEFLRELLSVVGPSGRLVVPHRNQARLSRKARLSQTA
jgi:EpsI family protein